MSPSHLEASIIKWRVFASLTQSTNQSYSFFCLYSISKAHIFPSLFSFLYSSTHSLLTIQVSVEIMRIILSIRHKDMFYKFPLYSINKLSRLDQILCFFYKSIEVVAEQENLPRELTSEHMN